MNLANILTDKKWEKITHYFNVKGYQDLTDIDEDVIMDLYFVPNISTELISELTNLMKSKENSPMKEINENTSSLVGEIKDTPQGKNNSSTEILQTQSENLFSLPWNIFFNKYELRKNIVAYLKYNGVFSIQELDDFISKNEALEINQVSENSLSDFINNFRSGLEELQKYSTIIEAKKSDKIYFDWDNFYSQIDLENYLNKVPYEIMYSTVGNILEENEIEINKRFVNKFSNYKVHKFIKDIHDLDFRGINIRDINEAITIIISFLDHEQVDSEEKDRLNIKLNEYIKSIDINKVLGVLSDEKDRSALTNLIEMNNLKLIKDIKNIDLSSKEKKIVFRLINAVNADFDKLHEDYINNMSDRDYEVIFDRALGDTLESIGLRIGVSRERVRQIAKRHSSKLHTALKNLAVIIEQERGWFTPLEVEEYFKNEEKSLIFVWIIKEQSKVYTYYSYANLFVNIEKITGAWEDKFKKIVNKNAEKFGDIFDLYSDIEEELSENGLNFIKKHNIEVFLTSLLNFKVSHNMYRQPSTVLNDFIANVMSESFEFDVKLDSREDNADIIKIRKIIQRDFPEIKLPTNNRAFTALATRNNNVVLSGRGRYVTEDKIFLPEYLREHIIEWINKNPNTTLTYNEVFEQNKGRLLTESNITNRHFLHGILKLYYEDEFDFNRDDFTKKGSKRTRPDDRLIELLNKNTSMTISEISKEIPGIQEYQISAIAERSEIIFKMSNKKLALATKIPFGLDEISLLDKIIEMLLYKNNEYISSKFFMSYLLHNNESLVKKSGLNHVGLFHYCRLKFSKKYRFSYPHIIPKGHELNQPILLYRTILDYFFIKDKQRISQSELEEFCHKYFWTEYVIYHTLQDLEEQFLRISDDVYILKNKINFIEEKKLEMDNYLDGLDFDFYAIQNFQIFSNMPEINTEWNVFLIESFVLQYSKKYRIIDRLNNYRHTVSSIIVPNTSKLETYEDLLVYIIKKEGKNRLTEKELLRILQNNGLTTSTIPLEVWNGEKIKYNDRINLFEILEN